MDIELPLKMLSDILGADRQEKGTTRDALNVTPLDPVDLVEGIAQRSGQIKHTSAAVVVGTKVSHLAQIVYDNPSHTYANLASAGCVVEWDTEAENRSNVYAGARDDLGNYFYVDGAAGLVKINKSGRKVWRIALPAAEPGSIVRAVAVDLAGRIYAAVSAGVQPEDARVWCYQPIEEDKPPELLWTLEPGWLTEELWVDGATLQASQNDPIGLFSRMALYSGLGLATPTLIREWEIPYPVNGHHFSPKDGSIFTAHQPNAQRTMTPRSPETTGSREDWTPRNLDSYGLRVWSWVDADDVDGQGAGNVDYKAGEQVIALVDKTGNGRGFVPYSTDTGPTMRKGGIAGRDSLYFNGTSNSMVSEAGVSIDTQVRGINRSFLPCYTKAQFACFMVVRLPLEATTRVLLGQSNSGTENRCLTQNAGIRLIGATPTYEGAVGVAGVYESAAGASGPTILSSAVPLPGGFDETGLTLITWIHDGGYDDVAVNPTRSTFRVNGRPCDRWTSATIFASLRAVHLGRSVDGHVQFTGMGRMLGDFCESIVLSDWYVAGFASTSVLAQKQLITTPRYPDLAWSADGDTELERIEGYLAHKWGLAHKLSTGQAAVFLDTNDPLNNETVTIDGVQYTFKTSLSAGPTIANEIVRGTQHWTSLTNLYFAINGAGVAGTNYSVGTVQHPTVFSPARLYNTETTGVNVAVVVQRRDPRVFATFATSEAVGTGSWLNGAASISARDGAGVNTGHYPHSFFLFRAYNSTGGGTPISRGGPPRTNSIGVTFPSVVGALISPYGMMVKWDPANGKARNLLTTDGVGNGFELLPIGGVGYGVRIGSDGSVFTIGPRQAAVTALGISADPIDVRKYWDKGAEDTGLGATSGWATALGATAITNWEANPGAQTYAYPRMDVDEWDNVYVPIYQVANGTSLAVYAKLGIGTGSFNADPLLVLVDLTNDPKAHAVLIDPEVPEFPAGYSKPRVEKVLLLTERPTTTNLDVLHRVRIVSATPAATNPRTTKRFAVVGAGLYDISVPASVSTVDVAAFSLAHRFIDECEAFGKLFWTDGTLYREYNPKATTPLSFYRARSSGEIPLRGQFMTRFVNRVFIAGFADAPERACASKAGDPYGWDFDPPGASPFVTAAWRSDLSPSGDFPDIVTGMGAWKDDYLYFGGARNVFLQRGDPLQGGRFDSVTSGVGMAFGRAWCFTPDGRFWWVSQEAEMWVASVGSMGVEARIVSGRIAKRLQDAIDFNVARVELTYEPRTRTIHVWQIPLGAGDTLYRHFRLQLDKLAWCEDSYGATGIQPTAVRVVDGDQAEDRVMLLGSRDGYIREWNAAAPGDDGTRIDSRCLIASLNDTSRGTEALVEDVRVLMARAQGGARIEAFASDESDDLGDPIDVHPLLPGRNTPNMRFSGAFTGLRVSGSTGVERWSLRRVEAMVLEAGMTRERGR